MSNEILAIAESKEGALKKSAFEVATAAADLARALGGKVVAVHFAEAPVAGLERLGRFGASEILSSTGAAFGRAGSGAIAAAIAELAKARGASAVLLPHSAAGKDIAPRVSALLNAPLCSDCVGLAVEGGAIHARRPVYAGKARWTVSSAAQPFLATLRPNVFTPKESGGSDVPAAAWQPANVPPQRLSLKEVLQPSGAKKIELTEADVIVSGGRGMKGPENYPILEELAAALGGTVGASRAAVDAGWRPHGDQVGQTGKTVSPSLYIACGISGAIQHLAGMSSSRVIVAINKDPEAPIFKIANYGIVGDLFEIVPALTAEVKRAKAGG